jgi:hypothetical protein
MTLCFVPIEVHAHGVMAQWLKPGALSMKPVPIFIETTNLRLELVRAVDAVLPGAYRAVNGRADDDTGWMWSVMTVEGESLGFMALNATPSSPDFDCYFGPHLALACRRDVEYAPYVPEAIQGLLDWLRVHDICFIVHADHGATDQQLAAWLVAAGFLYTGCRSRDGHQQMICLL